LVGTSFIDHADFTMTDENENFRSKITKITKTGDRKQFNVSKAKEVYSIMWGTVGLFSDD
jgi:hypothetical protein